MKKIQLAYGMKTLNIIKTSVTRWQSQGAACKRCCERCTVIVDVLDDIISQNPKPELLGHQSLLVDSKTFLEIAFLEDVLSITKLLSLVLQTDKKDFGAIRKVMNSTIIFTKMTSNWNTIHLKSFNSQNEVLMEMNTAIK